ncbi:MAG: zinc ribbon domain-containing protein [Candidatus Peribacter sp.]|nr:zinc ribbon domain-containing protein [Candidatus Peribacter sp.]
MPTYDFRCPKCSHHFEAILPFGSASRPLCPKCRHKKTEKLITPPAIHFKGTGFFVTDSRKKSPPGKKPAKTAPEVKPDTKKEPSTPPSAEGNKPDAKA